MRNDLKIPKKLKPPYLRQFVGLVLGYLASDQVVSQTGFPKGLLLEMGVIGALTVVTVVVIKKYTRGSYGRENYKYWIGQLGAWFISLLSGGFLPLLKSFVYSEDFWTEVILVPWAAALLYLFLLVQQWFETPKPVKPSSPTLGAKGNNRNLSKPSTASG